MPEPTDAWLEALAHDFRFGRPVDAVDGAALVAEVRRLGETARELAGQVTQWSGTHAGGLERVAELEQRVEALQRDWDLTVLRLAIADELAAISARKAGR